VEKMRAGRQLPHHLAAAHVLEAHRAAHRGGRRRLTLTPATRLQRRALERERRRHIHLRAREARAAAAGRDDGDNQLRARAGPLAPAAEPPPLGREAGGDDEQQRDQGGGGARLPDAQGRRDEHAEHQDGHTDDGDAVADGGAVAVDVVVVVVDGARLELEPRVHVEHGHGDRRERRLECTRS